MKSIKTIVALMLLVITTANIYSQSDDLKVYGFFQTNANYYKLKMKNNKNYNTQYTSFVLQQLNLLFAKNFGVNYSAFVNFEVTNGFSSKDSIGAMRIEEAWFKYSPSAEFNVKAGMLVPRFNNMNEIKNRTALLPYILRPLVYETAFEGQFSTDEFVPGQAYGQIYGEFSFGDLGLNYAAFIGSSERANLIHNDQLVNVSHDSTKYKMFGGRIGVSYNGLEAGVSATADHKSYWKYGIGHLARTRFGAYVNYSIYGFDLAAEYITVNYDVTAEKEAKLLTLKQTVRNTPTDFDKWYGYVNLTYNVTDDLFGYAGYAKVASDDNTYSTGGTYEYTGGVGYRLNDAIVVKAQYLNLNYHVGLYRNQYLVGASVNF